MVRDGLRPPHHEVKPYPEEPPAAASRRMRFRQNQTGAMPLGIFKAEIHVDRIRPSVACLSALANYCLSAPASAAPMSRQADPRLGRSKATDLTIANTVVPSVRESRSTE